jgi:hypothetical protein
MFIVFNHEIERKLKTSLVTLQLVLPLAYYEALLAEIVDSTYIIYSS